MRAFSLRASVARLAKDHSNHFRPGPDEAEQAAQDSKAGHAHLKLRAYFGPVRIAREGSNQNYRHPKQSGLEDHRPLDCMGELVPRTVVAESW